MTIKRLGNISVATAGVALCAGIVDLAAAQQTPSTNQLMLEEVVVTSRKREENLQEIPDSVTVLGADLIERAGMTTITDFAAMTPNLTAFGNFRPNLTNITIRGITSNQLGEPPVAFVVDGITVPNIEFINQGLHDIQSIEVIRGPQGALYDKNAIGGAINISTKQPVEEVEGSVRVSYGEGDDLGLSATLGGSVANERVIYRLSAFYRDSEGLIDDDFLDEPTDFVEEKGVQGLLGFKVTDQTYVDLRFRYSDGDYGVGWYDSVSADNVETDTEQRAHNVFPIDENKLQNASLKLEHDADAGTFLFVAGYNKSEDENFLDGDFTALPPDFDNEFFPAAQFSFVEDSATTIETRFTSPGDNRLRWQVGAFYQDRERDNDFDIIDDPVGNVRRNRSSFANELVFEIVRDRQQSEALALFGQLNYDATDALELTFALRYDEEDREGVDPRDPASQAEDTFDELQPKGSLAYQISENLLAYATLARGFRSGGFNEVGPGVTRTFDSEISDTLEIGFKSTLLEGMLTFNVAAFASTLDNAQFTRFNPVTFGLEQLAISEVENNGLELEGRWLPTEYLDVQFGFAWLDNEITEFDPEDFVMPPEGLTGNTMQRVAAWSANLAVTHFYRLTDGIDLSTRIAANWLGERYFDIGNTFKDDGATLVDLSVSLEAEVWTVAVRANNIFDELEPEDVIFGPVGPARFRNNPRQVLAELTYRF
ncbi:MAG: TonB-dependent receptor [Pseudomonadales bacterium]